jgi:hypothetical protein
MRFFAARQMRRNTLAVVLCVLSMLFAVEAKTAWYGPSSGLTVGVQNQKARPAELPAVISHGIAPHCLAELPQALFLRLSIAVFAKGTGFFPRNDFDSYQKAFSSSTFFSPGLFLRPPPAV